MKITFEKSGGLKITYPDGGFVRSTNTTDILLFQILDKLEEIRCGLIDIETKVGEK